MNYEIKVTLRGNVTATFGYDFEAARDAIFNSVRNQVRHHPNQFLLFEDTLLASSEVLCVSKLDNITAELTLAS